MRYGATGLSCRRSEQGSPNKGGRRVPMLAEEHRESWVLGSSQGGGTGTLPAHVGYRAQLPANPWNFIPPCGTGQDLLPASSDVGCCNPNCAGGVRVFPVSLSQTVSGKHSPE